MDREIIDIKKLESAAGKLKAIAHPVRIAIIEMLGSSESLHVTEIYQILNIEQASASHHLNILKNNGLLTSHREGKKIFYSLSNASLNEIINCINRCNEP